MPRRPAWSRATPLEITTSSSPRRRRIAGADGHRRAPTCGSRRSRESPRKRLVVGEFFVDTSAWYPLLVAKHPDHARLASALRGLIRNHRRLVTTNLVVAETHALLLRRVGHATAIAFVKTVDEAPNVVVRSTRDLESDAE